MSAPDDAPGLLRFVRLAGLPIGVLAVLMSLGFLAAVAMAPGPYFVNGVRAGRGEFLGFAVPFVAAYGLTGVLTVAVALGLRRRRTWARPLLFGLVLGMAAFSAAAAFVVGMPTPRMISATIGSALIVGSLWWYLYRRDDVVDWFERLEVDAANHRGE